jgi:hypothetical protein
MAREATKSQAIRDYLAANPNAKAKAVVEALAADGVEVNEGLVYSVKGAMKEKKRRKRRVARAATAATVKNNGTKTGHADAISMIKDVKALAERAGGYEKLKELVDALAE